MVTDPQVKRLRKLIHCGKAVAIAAAKAGMSENTARKYLRDGLLPSEVLPDRHWRNRKDPFEDDWEEITEFLQESPGLQAKTLFEYLQRTYPGRYQDGQLRTLQRRVKVWRATAGPPKEVFFAQKHEPGRLSCVSRYLIGQVSSPVVSVRSSADHLLGCQRLASL